MTALVRIGRLLGWLTCLGMMIFNLWQHNFETAFIFGLLAAIIGDLLILDAGA